MAALLQTNGRTDRETDPFCVYRRADVCRNREHAHKGGDSGRQGTIKGLYSGHVPGRTSVARATRFAGDGDGVHTPRPPGRQQPLRKRKGNPFFFYFIPVFDTNSQASSPSLVRPACPPVFGGLRIEFAWGMTVVVGVRRACSIIVRKPTVPTVLGW